MVDDICNHVHNVGINADRMKDLHSAGVVHTFGYSLESDFISKVTFVSHSDKTSELHYDTWFGKL